MKTSGAGPERVCTACGAHEPIEAGRPVWPVGVPCRGCGAVVPEHDGIPLFAPALAYADAGFDLAAFDRLARIEAGHFWFVARNELIVGLAERHFPNARSYLEIGCGNGAVLGALARSRRWERLVATDLHPAGLAHARQRLTPAVELAQMDATVIPARAAFELCGAYDIIEHVPDDEAALRAMRASTAPGGGAIIAVPQHPALWSRADEIGKHQRRYRRGELEAKLERSGYRVVFSSSYTVVLLPLMALNRLKARLLPADADADIFRELDVGPGLNRAFKILLRTEVRLTLAGMRWPAGGSRVVVAKAV